MPSIVGVLNVTPDSYFDGGRYGHTDDAVRRAGELLQEGADIIDIGGESTGPGSKDVSVDEELSRIVPVIKAIKAEYPDCVLSADTYKAHVAKEAVTQGVGMINDVTAGRGDSKMFATMTESDIPVVLMYSKDETARTTVGDREYDDVIADITEFLMKRIDDAVAAGVPRDRIIVDPGMGHFISSKPEYSFEVLKRLRELTDLGPVFVSPSRKSFLAGSENLPPADRLPGTIVASAFAAKNGASYIRTHDVLSVRRGCEIAMRL